MWIVKLALRRPYTFVVMSLVIIMLGVGAILRSPKDIFPSIDIPVVSVLWRYPGLSTQEMEGQMTTFGEFAISSSVNNIKNIESQTINGIAVIKIFFQPNVNVAEATAQVTAVSQTILRRMPPGTQPPYIIRYDAASVPVIQLSLSSDTMTESELYDYGLYRIRQQLAVIQGTRMPLPYGGKPRQINVDLDPQKLLAYGISPSDVATAVTAQNLTLPTGTAKIGERDYVVSLNSSPEAIDLLNAVPLKTVGDKTIFMRDVATVHDGFAVQTNVVRKDGKRAVMLSILKTGDASTLDIANSVKDLLPTLRASAPPGLNIELMVDQSKFVSGAIEGVLTEGVIAACLTGLMILLFLGSWRSTLIVTISIPLSILVAVIAMSALGQTLNIMTLGGLALAVGILVDDATVEIENIHRNIAMGKTLQHAILDGAQQIAVPAFVATLSISIVFLSLFFLEGATRYLFMPMGMAVGFSVMASYFLSRTIIPTLVKYLLRSEVEAHHAERHEALAHANPPKKGFNPFRAIHDGFNHLFEKFRTVYVAALRWTLHHRWVAFGLFGIAVAVTVGLGVPNVGRDFFPEVDAGQIRLQVRAPAGTRLEETEHYFSQVEDVIREVIPANERQQILDNIGIPDGINMAVVETSTISTADGEVLVSLNEERTHRTAYYVAKLREELPKRFPDLQFAFKPADIVTQILNFGLPAPIDIQVAGFNRQASYAAAQEIASSLKKVHGAVDVQIHQVTDAPRLHMSVDRTRIAEMGLTQRDVANDVLTSLSGTGVTSVNYWTDARNGINYPVVVQTPQYRLETLDDILNTPLTGRNTTGNAQTVRDVANIGRLTTPVVANHNNVQPTFNVRASVQDSDLGSVSAQIDKIVNQVKQKLPPGSRITVRGQVESMNSAFSRLGLGILFAAILVYMLMVVNFQSWVDPFIIITALPWAMIGIVWMLLGTHTTFNVPSLMGAIMTIGVATANSILMVTFANEQRREGKSATAAALAAGFTRLRPVIMTALAMIIGMLPMSLGLGEGGEQNAPLGRAVIGGLILATIGTLFFVPVVYSLVRGRDPKPLSPQEEMEQRELETAGAHE